MAITSDVLTALYGKLGVTRATYMVADGEYALPTKDYVINKFAGFYGNKLKDMGLGTWDNTWDCDDFAWMFYTDIRWAHYVSKKSMAEGVAVGVCYYMSGARAESGTGGGHAINTAVVDNRDIIFIEPQAAAQGAPCELILTRDEITSIWFVNY